MQITPNNFIYYTIQVFSIGIALVDIQLNWFYFLIIVAGAVVILLGYMVFLSPFQDASLTQLDSGILYLQNHFFWPLI